MTSLFNGATKVNGNDIGYYINVGAMNGKINAYSNVSGAVSLSTATWSYLATPTPISTMLSLGGQAIFKDMGKTVVSSNRTFRKVQLVYSTSLSTGGVAGKVGTSPVEDYYTGYIELGFDGTGLPAPVAHFGR